MSILVTIPVARLVTPESVDQRCTVKILAAGPAGTSTTGVSPSVRIVHSGKATG